MKMEKNITDFSDHPTCVRMGVEKGSRTGPSFVLPRKLSTLDVLDIKKKLRKLSMLELHK